LNINNINRNLNIHVVDAGKEMLYNKAVDLTKKGIEYNDSYLVEESKKIFNTLECFAYASQTRKDLHQQKYRNMKRRK
jgi:Ca-activated chloride channel family protein